MGDIDRAGQEVSFQIETTDVTKVTQILAAAPGASQFHTKKSGSANWSKYVFANCSLVTTSMNVRFGQEDSVLRLGGMVQFSDGAKTLDDILAPDHTIASEPGRTVPTRVNRPGSVSFDPVGAPGAIGPIHCKSLDLSMDAIVLSEYGDNDLGVTAVDVAGWNPLRVGLVFQDALRIAGPPVTTIAGQLVESIRGVLTGNFLTVGSGATRAFTINNLLWLDYSQREAGGYSEFSVRGEAGWVDGGTSYNMDTATKLFTV